jgi:quercetin dioxygenase-like cupin family protein
VARDDATDLRTRLRNEGLDPGRWSNGPGDRYAAHEHAYDKVIVVESGSIAFGLAERGEVIEVATGDRLELPAGTSHDALVGRDGVTCLEAHVPVGTLGQVRRIAATDW